ncbi:hypothetical protein X777_15081 [Ooceraea biroi]|uniref:Uncharacterized protein n=1 Tax=Ooceraea biroi TaxID=2015173 RepID=A0A026WYG0_OOCBI|nr:hypothetical protein X777_15081 [Ooceraea biroi]
MLNIGRVKYIEGAKFLPISPCLAIGKAWIFKISKRACSLGSGISIFLSNLPGRNNAGSKVSGLFVAIIILT